MDAIVHDQWRGILGQELSPRELEFTLMVAAGMTGKEIARADAGVPKSAFQLRDLRAKAGTDKAESSGDIMQAKDQLGHTTVTMTEHYVRYRKGKKVMPTK